jgi:hypothetical protein
MKLLNLLSWITLLMAILIMIFGSIDFLFYGIAGGFLGVAHTTTFFHVASSVLLLTISFKLFEHELVKNP